MRVIKKLSFDDNLYVWRAFFPDEPNVLAIKHEGHSITMYCDANDISLPETEMQQFEFISVNTGVHVKSDYKYVGYYELNKLLYFIYMKRV
jgi:hypothetical protein